MVRLAVKRHYHLALASWTVDIALSAASLPISLSLNDLMAILDYLRLELFLIAYF